MSQQNFSVDDILAELSENRGMTYEKRAILSKGETDLLVDDILADTSLHKKGEVAPAPESVAPKAEQEEAAPLEKEEKKPRKKSRKKEETMELLAQITPWSQRHKENPDNLSSKSGVRESQDFLASLKKEQTQVVEQSTQLLYKSAGGVHPPVEDLPTPDLEQMEEVATEELKQRVHHVAEEMESTYEPTRHVIANPSSAPKGFENPTVAVSLKKKIKEDELTGQLRFPGFETAEQPPIEEVESWEGEFLSGREEKINEFHMEKTFEGEDTLPKSFEEDGEYHTLQDVSKVKFDLLSRRRSASLRFAVVFGLFVFTLLLTLVDRFDITNGLLSDNPLVTLGLYGGSLLICVLLNLRLLAGGIAALFRGGDQDTPAALGLLFAVGQGATVALLGVEVLQSSVFTGLLGCAAQVTLLLNLWGKRLLFTRMYQNFELVGNNRVKKVVTSVENKEEAFELGRGLAIGSPDVTVSRKAVQLDSFMYHSYAPDMAETAIRIPLYLLPLFGIVGGLIAYFSLPALSTHQTVFHVVSGALGCMQIALPVTVLLAGNLPFRWFGKHLRSQKIMMSGYDALAEFKNTDVLAVDAADLFPAGTVSLKSIKSASNQSLDRSIIDVAGVVYMADSPLKPLFESIVQGKTNLLPEVDTLVYEEGMGISGWVMGYRVLVGNRQLMETHGVALPLGDYEDKENDSGLKAVYLSTQGILSAVFLVQYSVNPKVKVGLQRAIKDGMSLHVYSCDPNVTAELICKMFRLPAASVRIMGAVPRRLYKQQMEQEKAPEAILSYEGNAGTYAVSVCAAKKLYRVIRFASILQTLFVILGALGFCAGLYFLGQNGVPGLALTLYHFISTLVVVALPRLMGR